MTSTHNVILYSDTIIQTTADDIEWSDSRRVHWVLCILQTWIVFYRSKPVGDIEWSDSRRVDYDTAF